MRKHVLIIAEAGVNHNGDLDRAVELIKVAAKSGADYIKFQTFITELNISKDAKKADYQIANTGTSESQFEMVKKLELTFDHFRFLKEVCVREGIKFSSTAFDSPSIDFLDELGVDFFKIPSGEITNQQFLEKVASKQKPIIMSTGMATLEEIEHAIKIIEKKGANRSQVKVLHCNTEYPTPMQDVNLMAMKTIERQLNVRVGYSDHTLGIEVPVAAVALGADVIEKHFTLDKTLPGPDHKASVDPKQLEEMVRSIRNIELAISGSGEKKPSQSEAQNLKIVRKSLHYVNDKKPGDSLQDSDLISIRPGDGISPMAMGDIVGRKLRIGVKAFSKVSLTDFE